MHVTSYILSVVSFLIAVSHTCKDKSPYGCRDDVRRCLCGCAAVCTQPSHRTKRGRAPTTAHVQIDSSSPRSRGSGHIHHSRGQCSISRSSHHTANITLSGPGRPVVVDAFATHPPAAAAVAAAAWTAGMAAEAKDTLRQNKYSRPAPVPAVLHR